VDSADVLRDPAGVLERLCESLGVEWLPDAMLRWPPGPRESDGVWAPHWYQSVESSTGFAPYSPRPAELAVEHRALADSMNDYYQQLAQRRLQPLANAG
jgi:hypothetical protein